MPNYSVDKLTTTFDCDAVLTIAASEQKNLEWKKLSLERQEEQYEKNAVGIAAELVGKQAEKAALDTVIDNLPDGPTKNDNIIKRTKVEYSIFLLENRKANYGDVALLEKELELQRAGKELEEIATFIAEVEARKAAI
ncbi:hypothetical protein [Niabella ginsenosidivorans]|nr:hypothetical protein [Niabella ginsenosidivorans]